MTKIIDTSDVKKISPAGEMMDWFRKNIGLTGREISCREFGSPDDKIYNFSIHFAVNIHPYQFSVTEQIDSYVSTLRERVRDSEEVKRMVMDVVATKDELQYKVNELQKELEELRPLKNHYDIEMKLRHGDMIPIDGLGIPKSGLR